MMHRAKVGALEVTFDDVAWAAYVYLPGHERPHGRTDATLLEKGVLLDLDADGELIGVEILLPVKGKNDG